jgi:ATP-dependent RNA helicase RhlE
MDPVPPAVSGFESLNLHPDILKGIRHAGFMQPTPIQAQAIPVVLSGRDLIGSAQTGTGKTAAFLLPTLHRLLQGKRGKNLRALVITPTRELALQCMERLQQFSRYLPLKGAAIFGGVPMGPQISALSSGVDIVSATPGRLLDHIYSGRIDFVDLEVLVLDEADRMLDMGFLPAIQSIVRLLPKKRQTMLFSATIPPDIQKLSREVLHDPVTVQIGQRSSVAVGIRHAVYPVAQALKMDLLHELLRDEEMSCVLVFARTKHSADRITRRLEQAGHHVSVLHSDRSQSQRLQALDKFRRGKTQIMVATDIAARGIDVEQISHVINFDVPRAPEDYIHRIGRTARADATGDAFTLVDRSEEETLREIEKVLGKKLPRVTLPNFDYKKAVHSDLHHRRHFSGGGRHPQHRSRGGGHSSHYGGRSSGRPHRYSR